jgi:hypothetical protein
MTALLAAKNPANPMVAPGDGLTNLFESVVAIFSSVNMLAEPHGLVTHLRGLSVVWGVVFVVVGLLCLLSGARHYKAVTVSLAFLFGLFFGYWLGKKVDAAWVVGMSLGIVLAVAAYPAMKYTVAIFGGLAGAFFGVNLWTGVAHALNKGAAAHVPVDSYWIGGLVGLLVCGMLAFIVFKFSVVMFTSVVGATIGVLGVLCLMLSFQPWQASIATSLTKSNIVVPLLVFVPAFIGLIMQQAWTPELAPAGAPAGGGGGSKK